MLVLPDRIEPRARILLPQRWQGPSARRAVYGLEDCTRWRLTARLHDGHRVWRGWFDDRDDADAFLWAMACGSLHVEPALWRLPTPMWPGLDPALVYDFATVTFLTASPGGNETYNVPADWDSSANTVETIGGGGGGASGTTVLGGGGGAGGAYSAEPNITLTPSGTATYQIGAATGDSWFNGATLGASSVGAKGGTAASGITPGTGGASASGVGTTKYSGGDGGDGRNPGSGVGGGGGGGAAGPAGAGAAGGANLSGGVGGGGGGGSGGGTAGADCSTANGGDGGNNSDGVGSGAGGTTTADPGDPGTSSSGFGSGGGGGGWGRTTGGSGAAGGAGGSGQEWDASHGSGGGGGAGGRCQGSGTAGAGANGGSYGGGGGGGGGSSGGGTAASGGSGIQGLIVITYTPAAGSGQPIIKRLGGVPFVGNRGVW